MLMLMLMLSLCLLPFLLSTPLAAPLDGIKGTTRNPFGLVKRTGESENNPVDCEFEINRWPSVAEEDCFAALCVFDGNRVLQRVKNADADAAANRRASGATLNPFRADQLAQRHTDQINSGTTTSEEHPWANTQQGGAGAISFPATIDEQRAQGSALAAGFSNCGVQFGEWFRWTLKDSINPLERYCTALFQTPSDTPLCDKHQPQTLFGTPGILLEDFAYKFDKTARPYAFTHAAGAHKGQFTQRPEYMADTNLVEDHGDSQQILVEAYYAGVQDL